MAVTKTGVKLSNDGVDLDFFEVGEVNAVRCTNLQPFTQYEAQPYFVQDGVTIYGDDTTPLLTHDEQKQLYILNSNDSVLNFTMQIVGTPPVKTLEYSFDGSKWTKFTLQSIQTLSIDPGKKLWLRGTENFDGLSSSPLNYIHFDCDDKFEVYGPLEILIDYKTFDAVQLTSFCFTKLFYGDKNLIKAPSLVNKNLYQNCFGSLYGGCVSLKYVFAPPVSTWDSAAFNGWLNGAGDEASTHILFTISRQTAAIIPSGASGSGHYTVQVMA